VQGPGSTSAEPPCAATPAAPHNHTDHLFAMRDRMWRSGDRGVGAARVSDGALPFPIAAAQERPRHVRGSRRRGLSFFLNRSM